MKEKISYLETLKAIDDCKKHFESQLEVRLGLTKVQSPLFVKTSSGLQDQLSGTEKAVSFTKGKEKFEVVHSLAKWKRDALSRYDVPLHQGIYTDMRAIRTGEKVDDIHSLFIEQWDWEKVIEKSDRTIDYLKQTVISIYKAIRQTSIFIKRKYHYLTMELPKTVYFITSQELEDLYPDKTLRVDAGIKSDTRDIKSTYLTIQPAAWNKIFKKDLFKHKVLFKKGVWFEDVEFIYRLLPYVKSIGVIHEPFNQYVQREGSITNTVNPKIYDYIHNMNGILDYYREKGLYEKYKRDT